MVFTIVLDIHAMKVARRIAREFAFELSGLVNIDAA
jgi:hypothetical protein